MLSFAEEIYLLALDDATGKPVISTKDIALGVVMVGAVLSELALLGKIDNDHENLFILDTKNTGSPILDEPLEVFRKSQQTETTIRRCLQVLMPHAGNIEELVIEELVKKGIVKQVEEKVLWVFPSRRYPIINDQEITDVETRICNLVLSENEIPNPRDAVLVCLIDAAGLFSEILSPRQLHRAEPRIKQLAKLDLIGQKIQEMIIYIRDIATLPPFV